MKKAMIALSAILVAAPVFAATTTHIGRDTVAAAHEGANTAKEKLHGPTPRVKSSSSLKHAAEGKSDSVGSEVSEERRKPGIRPKKGREGLERN